MTTQIKRNKYGFGVPQLIANREGHLSRINPVLNTAACSCYNSSIEVEGDRFATAFQCHPEAIDTSAACVKLF